MKPLKTLKGSKIWYSKFGVGKQVGSKIYFHKSVHDKIVPQDVWDKAVEILEHTRPLKGIETVCYDLKKPNVIRFDICRGFNFQSEPMVEDMIYVDISMDCVVKHTYNQQIYHHKWLWVEKDYKGFDVNESYEWSKLWLSKINETASGYPCTWEEQLKKYNVL